MIALFGGGLAITSIAALGESLLAVIPIAVGATGFSFGALVLYGAHLRRRGPA
jgi:hypothetical protein